MNRHGASKIREPLSPPTRPSVEVFTIPEILNDESAKRSMAKHIKETLGIDDVIFKEKEAGEERDVVLVGSISPSLSARQALLENTTNTFLSFLIENGFSNEIDSVAEKMLRLHDHYLEEVEVTVITDVPYGPELEKQISEFCVSYIGAKKAVLINVLDPTQGGGFKIKWRDLVYDATYPKDLKGF